MERTPVLRASGSVSLVAKVPGGLRPPEGWRRGHRGRIPYWGGVATGTAGGSPLWAPLAAAAASSAETSPNAAGPLRRPTAVRMAGGEPPSGNLFPDPLGGRYLSATRFGGTRTTGLRGFGPTLFIHRCGNSGWRGRCSLPPGTHPSARRRRWRSSGRRWLASPFCIGSERASITDARIGKVLRGTSD
jgi:hypothetical protein